MPFFLKRHTFQKAVKAILLFVCWPRQMLAYSWQLCKSFHSNWQYGMTSKLLQSSSSESMKNSSNVFFILEVKMFLSFNISEGNRKHAVEYEHSSSSALAIFTFSNITPTFLQYFFNISPIFLSIFQKATENML